MSPQSNRKTSTWSAVNFKKTSMSCRLEPMIWSHDTGQRIPSFDRCQKAHEAHLINKAMTLEPLSINRDPGLQRSGTLLRWFVVVVLPILEALSKRTRSHFKHNSSSERKVEFRVTCKKFHILVFL